jgi:hypothetical protein
MISADEFSSAASAGLVCAKAGVEMMAVLASRNMEIERMCTSPNGGYCAGAQLGLVYDTHVRFS